MALYFFEAGNLIAKMLAYVLMWHGRRVAAWGICLSLQIYQILRTSTISLTTSATGRHLGFERDYNTAFRQEPLAFGRYYVMYKVIKQRVIQLRNISRQRHDRVQTESQDATVDNFST